MRVKGIIQDGKQKNPYEVVNLTGEKCLIGTYLVRFGFEDKISNLLSKNSYRYCDKCNEDI